MLPLRLIYVCLLLGLGEVLACRLLYLNGEFPRYHCPSGNNMVANITKIERSKCFFLCMQKAECMVMAYNENEEQCELFNEVCVEAEEHGNFALTALGPPRLHSIQWRTYGSCVSNLVLVNQDAITLLVAWKKGGWFYLVGVRLQVLTNASPPTIHCSM